MWLRFCHDRGPQARAPIVAAGGAIVDAAAQQGNPYEYGADGPDSFVRASSYSVGRAY